MHHIGVKLWGENPEAVNRVPKEIKKMYILDEKNEEAMLTTLASIIAALAFVVMLNLSTQILGLYGFFR